MLTRACRVAAGLLAVVLVSTVAAQSDPVIAAISAKWNPAQQGVKDITMTATMNGQTPNGPMTMDMTIKRKGPKVRTEMNMGGMEMVSIFDGKDYWMVTPMGVQRAPASQSGPAQAFRDSLPPDARTAGAETVSGRDCHIIEYKESTGSAVRLWVDKKTLSPVKSESREGKKTNTVLFSDHRKVSKDYEMPHKIEMIENGKPMGSLVIKSVQVNAGLSDDLFAPQAPTGGMTMPMMPAR